MFSTYIVGGRGTGYKKTDIVAEFVNDNWRIAGYWNRQRNASGADTSGVQTLLLGVQDSSKRLYE